MIAAQIHEAFRGIPPYPDLQISLQIPENFLHAISSILQLKVADASNITDDFHVLVRIIIDHQAAAADGDLAGLALKDDGFLRIFNDSFIILHPQFKITRHGQDGCAQKHILWKLKRIDQLLRSSPSSLIFTLRRIFFLFPVHTPIYAAASRRMPSAG